MKANLKVQTYNTASFTDKNMLNVLIVDDEEVIIESIGYEVMDMGHNYLAAYNGQQALDMLESKYKEIDIVLMDRTMPIMSGMEVIKKMKVNHAFKHIPIVMVTGNSTKECMKEGIEEGVFYYLTKPFEDDILRSVVSAALRKSKQDKNLLQELEAHFTGFELFQTATFQFSTCEEASNLSAFVANFFPNPTQVLTGLSALMENAVEHGNLGIGFQEKGELLASGAFENEVAFRQQSDEHREKSASMAVAKKEDGIYVVIEDMGDGFDWQKYLEIDPTRAGSTHGRGIAQANALSFDKLTYNEKGNKAVAFVANTAGINW